MTCRHPLTVKHGLISMVCNKYFHSCLDAWEELCKTCLILLKKPIFMLKHNFVMSVCCSLVARLFLVVSQSFVIFLWHISVCCIGAYECTCMYYRQHQSTNVQLNVIWSNSRNCVNGRICCVYTVATFMLILCSPWWWLLSKSKYSETYIIVLTLKYGCLQTA